MAQTSRCAGALVACVLLAWVPAVQGLHLPGQNAPCPRAAGLSLRGGCASSGAPSIPQGSLPGAPTRQDSSDIMSDMPSDRDLSSSVSLERLGSSASISQLEMGTFGMRRVPKTMELLQFMVRPVLNSISAQAPSARAARPSVRNPNRAAPSQVPTFGIFLANPILSLVDTASVGQFCPKEALAALGPGTALCDMVRKKPSPPLKVSCAQRPAAGCARKRRYTTVTRPAAPRSSPRCAPGVGVSASRAAPPPPSCTDWTRFRPSPRTKWTHLVLHPVLSGHVSSARSRTLPTSSRWPPRRCSRARWHGASPAARGASSPSPFSSRRCSPPLRQRGSVP